MSDYARRRRETDHKDASFHRAPRDGVSPPRGALFAVPFLPDQGPPPLRARAR